MEREQPDVLVDTTDGLQNGRLPHDNKGSHRVPVNRHAIHIRPLIYNKRLTEPTAPASKHHMILMQCSIFYLFITCVL